MGKVKILAIDNNPENLVVLKELMAVVFPEYPFISAPSTSKGIELCLSEKPDVILLDIALSEKDNYEIFQSLKTNEATKTIPIIILTASQNDKRKRIKALVMGANAFLAYPLDESELKAQIRAMIRIKKSEDQVLNEKERLIQLVNERTEALQIELNERKQAQEALQDSEEKYSILFMNSPDSYLIIKDGLIIDCNKATEDMLGGDRSRIVGQLPAALSPEFQPDGKKSTESAKEKIDYAFKFGKNSFEWLHRRFDGSDLYVEVSIAPMILKGKQTLFTTWRDITDRKIAERALKESESQFKEFFEKAADAIFIADIESGIIVDANDAACKLILMPLTQIVGLHQSQLHPSVNELYSQNSFKQHTDSVQQKLSTLPVENVVVRSDGMTVPVEVLASEVVLKGKSYIMGTFRDISVRKNAEIALLTSEANLNAIVENTFESIWSINTSYEIIHINKIFYEAFFSIFGVKLIQGSNVINALPKELKVLWKERYNRAFKNERFVFEDNFELGGKQMCIEVAMNPILIDGIVVGASLIGRDISERKQAEEKLRESEYFFKESQRAAFVGSYKFEVQNDFWTSSEVLEQIFGIDEKYIKSFQSWLEITHPDDREMMARYFSEDVLAKRQPFNKEYRIISQSDGEIHWVLGLGKLNLDAEGNVVEMIGTIQDITERKLAEHALKEREQLFQELFNASPDAIVLIDPHHPSVSWQILDCNAASCQLNGYTREEMIGQSIDLLNVSLGSKEERITYLNMLRRDKVIHTETCHRHKDGHIFLIEVSTSIISIGGRELILGIDRDITERKQAEDTIRLNEDRLRRAELASKSGNWEYYLDSQTMVGSVGAAKVYGIEGDRFNYEVIKNIPLPEYRSVLDTALKNLLENEIAYDIEFKIKAVDTHEIKDIHSVAFHNKEKKIVFGIIQDVTDRKQAETELIQSEDRYRRFISQISEGVYRFECDVPMDINLPLEEQIDFIYDHMIIAECNSAFQKMYGLFDEKEVIGKSHLNFHGGRDNTLNRSALREFVNNGYRIEGVMTEEISPVNGQLMYFSNNSLGIIENNHLVRIWGTQSDVTEKIRADQVQEVLFSISNAALSSIDLHKLIEFISEEVGKLLDSTNFYIAFYDEKTDMLSTLYERDEKDVFETWPAENSITGYVVKHQKSLLLREEDVDAFYAAAGIQAIGTPSKVWLGVPLKTNKKTIGAIVVQSYDNVNAYTEKDKQMLEFISHQIGISIERKRTEQDLKLMGKAFDQSPVTIVITDKEGNIEYTNPKFSESTGYTLDEVKGKNPRILQSGNQSKEYYQELWRTILDGKDWVGEFQNKRKNGETYWDSAVISPITNESGEIAFFLAIKEDITEKKKMIDDLVKAKEKAQESDRLKSSFLANMSHEIRTPLNSIIGFSELLLDKEFGMEQHEEFARTINSSGNGLLTIISDIMDLSKIESGQVQVKKESFSVTKLINEIQKEYSYRALEKGLELRLDPGNPNGDFFIESDEQRLRQILINFVGNAIKFTEEGFVQIGFGLESGSDKVIDSNEAHGRDNACLVSTMRFFVKDTGIGIPEEYHQQIFERFRQVEVSHTRKYGGNGLGLAISKNLIEMLGGEIGLESNVGKGSTFYFTIPVC